MIFSSIYLHKFECNKAQNQHETASKSIPQKPIAEIKKRQRNTDLKAINSKLTRENIKIK